MPTARHSSSIITMATAIIAAGGESMGGATAAVEVYNDNTSQWYTAEPLPAPHANMSSVVIDDFCYLMRDNDCYRASLSSLVQRATSPTPPSATGSESLWKTLPPTPLKNCSAACLNGSLMTVGGWCQDVDGKSCIYIFLDNKWVRLMHAKLPVGQWSCGAAQLSSDEVIIVGGRGSLYYELNNVCIGTLLKD